MMHRYLWLPKWIGREKNVALYFKDGTAGTHAWLAGVSSSTHFKEIGVAAQSLSPSGPTFKSVSCRYIHIYMMC